MNFIKIIMKTCKPKILFHDFFSDFVNIYDFADLLKDSIDFFSDLEKNIFPLLCNPVSNV